MRRFTGHGALARRVILAGMLAVTVLATQAHWPLMPVLGEQVVAQAPRLPTSLCSAAVPPAGPAAAPAWGDDGVAVRGVAALPAGEVAWRLVADVAERHGEARFEQRSLGFALPRPVATPFQTTDEATGAAYRVDGDGAAFVPESIVQKRESLGDQAVGYLRLALVPAAKAEDAGGDRLLFAGEPFAAPAGSRELTLLRFALQAGDSVPLTGGAGETFVLVEQGSVVVSGAAGQATLTAVVGCDTHYEAGTYAGDIHIVGNRDATNVVVAIIGNPV